MESLPLIEKEILKLPRQYIINTIYTKVGLPFKEWVDLRVDERHTKVAEDGDLYIEMDAEIAEAYKNSKAVSTTKGCSYNLMKASSKRRRTK